jgi:hypothetical protein
MAVAPAAGCIAVAARQGRIALVPLVLPADVCSPPGFLTEHSSKEAAGAPQLGAPFVYAATVLAGQTNSHQVPQSMQRGGTGSDHHHQQQQHSLHDIAALAFLTPPLGSSSDSGKRSTRLLLAIVSTGCASLRVGL